MALITDILNAFDGIGDYANKSKEERENAAIELLNKFKELGGNVNQRVSKNGATLLLAACYRECKKAATHLVEKLGADVNLRFTHLNYPFSALELAIEMGHNPDKKEFFTGARDEETVKIATGIVLMLLKNAVEITPKALTTVEDDKYTNWGIRNKVILAARPVSQVEYVAPTAGVGIYDFFKPDSEPEPESDSEPEPESDSESESESESDMDISQEDMPQGDTPPITPSI